MALNALESTDDHVKFFRLSFDLGSAIEQHRGELVAALHQGSEPSGQDLFEFLLTKSLSWADVHLQRLSRLDDYDDHVELVRGEIRAEKLEAARPLLAVCDKIANCVSAIPPDQLAHFIAGHNRRAFELVHDAIRLFGGDAALRVWSSCQCAALDFTHQEEEMTRCTFRRTADGDVITVRIGSHVDAAKDPLKGSLRTYFKFPVLLFSRISLAFIRRLARRRVRRRLSGLGCSPHVLARRGGLRAA